MDSSGTKITPNNSCMTCQKQSIYNMQCRCNMYFCKKHFLPEKHKCTYDFTEHKKNELKDDLQKIENKRIEVL